jgi:hypothetical protein
MHTFRNTKHTTITIYLYKNVNNLWITPNYLFLDAACNWPKLKALSPFLLQLYCSNRWQRPSIPQKKKIIDFVPYPLLWLYQFQLGNVMSLCIQQGKKGEVFRGISIRPEVKGRMIGIRSVNPG